MGQNGVAHDRTIRETRMLESRRWVSVLFLVLAGFLAAGSIPAGDANLLYGTKRLTEERLSDLQLEDQTEAGLAVSLDVGLPVLLAVDILGSSETSRIDLAADPPTVIETEVSSVEINVGVRQVWAIKRAHPYAGGGLAWIDLETRQFFQQQTDPGGPVTGTILDDSDGGIGFWINFGFMYRVGRSLNVGADLRYSHADAALSAESVPGEIKLDSGGIHGLLLVGYHW
jgi:hypothetical protein